MIGAQIVVLNEKPTDADIMMASVSRFCGLFVSFKMSNLLGMLLYPISLFLSVILSILNIVLMISLIIVTIGLFKNFRACCASLVRTHSKF